MTPASGSLTASHVPHYGKKTFIHIFSSTKLPMGYQIGSRNSQRQLYHMVSFKCCPGFEIKLFWVPLNNFFLDQELEPIGQLCPSASLKCCIYQENSREYMQCCEKYGCCQPCSTTTETGKYCSLLVYIDYGILKTD